MTTSLSESAVSRDVMVGDPLTQAYVESNVVKETKVLAAELCRHFYNLGWMPGTGGSIAIKVHEEIISRHNQLIVMSPSGVQKERMAAEDMYVLSSDGCVLSEPLLKSYPHKPPKCTDCASLFLKVYELCNAGAIIHSHGIESCVATKIHQFSKEFRITHMEMIKGIQGHGYHDELIIPIIENTAHEAELTESFAEAIRAYPNTTAVLVRDHGVYIWGESWINAKSQAECYHYLFDVALKLHQLGLDCISPFYDPNHSASGCGRNMNKHQTASAISLDPANKISHHYVLLDIDGTATPLSFCPDIPFPYTNNIAVNQDGIARSKANIDLLQSRLHICRMGYHMGDLLGIVFDDVPEALERWRNLEIKVYIYSSHSREAQQLLFRNSNHGDLKKFFSGFFDTSVGSKIEAHSYVEIVRTVGVNRPADMLFVTGGLPEAVAAQAAGLEVIISVRPGNGSVPENHGFRTIQSFSEI